MCTSAQSFQSLRCLPKIFARWLSRKTPGVTVIKLHGCASWSESSLFALWLLPMSEARTFSLFAANFSETDKHASNIIFNPLSIFKWHYTHFQGIVNQSICFMFLWIWQNLLSATACHSDCTRSEQIGVVFAEELPRGANSFFLD